MEDLRASDLRAVLGALGELRDLEDPAEFPAAVIRVMENVVAADVPSYNAVDLRTRTVVAMAPRRSLFPDAEELVGRYAHQDPTVAYYTSTADGSARRLSDFLTRRSLHKLDIYNLVYRQLQLEHMISIVLSDRGRGTRSSATQVRLSFGRRSLRFSERDRAVLNTIRPFLLRAKNSVEEVHELRDALRYLDGAEAAAGRMVIVLDSAGGVAHATPPAAKLLRSLGWRHSLELPEPLRSWASRRSAGSLMAEPLSLRGRDGTLTARLLHGREGEPNLVTLTSTRDPTSLSSPLAREVTEREAQVLRAVARGLSNGEVASELGISTHTVAKHLQHIYARLGVRNRTAAVRAAQASDRKIAVGSG
ncbi:MAG: helix-turn-helix transcriptional regulator [Actinomycetota bacterium]|nr:helix-turn-helix transcriptional regulator [Actinomycetota bacterium]